MLRYRVNTLSIGLPVLNPRADRKKKQRAVESTTKDDQENDDDNNNNKQQLELHGNQTNLLKWRGGTALQRSSEQRMQVPLRARDIPVESHYISFRPGWHSPPTITLTRQTTTTTPYTPRVYIPKASTETNPTVQMLRYVAPSPMSHGVHTSCACFPLFLSAAWSSSTANSGVGGTGACTLPSAPSPSVATPAGLAAGLSKSSSSPPMATRSQQDMTTHSDLDIRLPREASAAFGRETRFGAWPRAPTFVNHSWWCL